MEPHEQLIRTGIRSKLPKGLSHPVGAEVISRTLHGCPRYHELWIAFGSEPLPVQHALSECINFRLVFTVVCNNPSGSWYVSVPAVPSETRAVVRGLLISFGLSAAREWLGETRYETWYEGFRTFQIGYATHPLRACLVESLNDKIVASSVVVVEDTTAE